MAMHENTETNAALEAAGWTVLRFWSHQSPEEAATEVLQKIKD